jgi:hypothetical protein
MPIETARLLEAWRQAERAAGAAHLAAEHAMEAAEAAAKAAEAARLAAEDAGVSVEEADLVARSAKDAFHQRAAGAGDQADAGGANPPQGLAQPS